MRLHTYKPWKCHHHRDIQTFIDDILRGHNEDQLESSNEIVLNHVVCLPFTHGLSSFHSRFVFLSLTVCLPFTHDLSSFHNSSESHGLSSFHSRFVFLSLTVCLPFTHGLSSFHSRFVFLSLTVCLPFTHDLSSFHNSSESHGLCSFNFLTFNHSSTTVGLTSLFFP